jgi:hypothetical protein
MTDEELFDLVVPPGTPRSIIRDIAVTFEVETVGVTRPLNYANMVNDERELLAFRGSLSEMQKVEAYLKEKLQEFIES